MSPSFFGLVASGRDRLTVLARTYKRDGDGQFSSTGGGDSGEDPNVGEADDEGEFGYGRDAAGVSYTEFDVDTDTGEPKFSAGYREKYGPISGDDQVGESSYRLVDTERGNIHIADDAAGTKNRVVVQEFSKKQARSLGDDVYEVNTGGAARTNASTGVRVEPHGPASADGSVGTTITWSSGGSVTLTADDTFGLQESLDLSGGATNSFTPTFHANVHTRREQVELLARVYKRDSHGRFGSGGVRESLADAKTTGEIADATKAEAKKITGRDLAVDFSGSDPQIAREHAEGVLQGLERFPAARLERVDTYGPGSTPTPETPKVDQFSGAMAVTGSRLDLSGKPVLVSSIHFNNKFGADPDNYRAVLGQPASKSCIASTPTGTALHEFGHVIADHDAGAPRRVLDEAVRQSGVAGQSTQVYVTQHVSNYGASNQHELAAEVFTDVMTHGSGASSMSQSGFDIMESAYNASVGPGNRTDLPRARTYKRDKDGRFGSGGGSGVRESLAKAGTTEEVSAILASEASRITGRTVRVDMTGSDAQIAREHAEGVLQGFEKYPAADVRQIITYGPGSGRPDAFEGQGGSYACAGIAPTKPDGVIYDWTIGFNAAYAGDADKYRASLQESEDGNWTVPGGPMSTALHEFGHGIARQTYAATAAKRIATEHAHVAGTKPSAEVRSKVSDYAATNSKELAAEAFADVMVHGSGASDVSQAIVADMDARYERTYP